MRARPWLIAGAVLLVVAVAGTPAILARVFELPPPTGRFAVGTVALPVPPLAAIAGLPDAPAVQIWYPARATGDRAPYGYANAGSASHRRWFRTHAARGPPLADTGGRLPILVYVAGWGGRRTDNTALAEELASHGYLVAGIDDMTVDLPPGAGLAALMDFSSEENYARTLAVGGRKVVLEAKMASGVLDFLARLDAHDPDGRFTNRLDLGRAGIFGFSVGGSVAAEAARQDPRFRAAMNLDGWLFGPVATEGISQPYFLANTVDPDEPPFDPNSSDPTGHFIDQMNRIDDRRQTSILARTGGYRLSVSGTTHDDFTDDPFFSIHRELARRTAYDPVALVRLLGAYTLAFFDMALDGTPPGPLLTKPPSDPRLTLKIFR